MLEARGQEAGAPEGGRDTNTLEGSGNQVKSTRKRRIEAGKREKKEGKMLWKKKKLRSKYSSL